MADTARSGPQILFGFTFEERQQVVTVDLHAVALHLMYYIFFRIHKAQADASNGRKRHGQALGSIGFCRRRLGAPQRLMPGRFSPGQQTFDSTPERFWI